MGVDEHPFCFSRDISDEELALAVMSKPVMSTLERARVDAHVRHREWPEEYDAYQHEWGTD
jgi:hypothetical protein